MDARICILLLVCIGSAVSMFMGKRESGCACILLYDPVCDPATRTTYGNLCEATCINGLEEGQLIKGECPPTPPPCVCALIYNPVCAGGESYPNECSAKCAGQTSFQPGECVQAQALKRESEPLPDPPELRRNPCICPRIYDPVCNPVTRKTYSNLCMAGCLDGLEESQVKGGRCETEEEEEGCFCPAVYRPVCDVRNGKEYSNQCRANCEGVTDTSPGPCVYAQKRDSEDLPEESCGCIDLYQPVCGEDGKTYNNECWAQCDGVEVDKPGEC